MKFICHKPKSRPSYCLPVQANLIPSMAKATKSCLALRTSRGGRHSLAVDEDVGAFEISVEESLRVAVVQSFDQLSGQALDVELREPHHT